MEEHFLYLKLNAENASLFQCFYSLMFMTLNVINNIHTWFINLFNFMYYLRSYHMYALRTDFFSFFVMYNFKTVHLKATVKKETTVPH